MKTKYKIKVPVVGYVEKEVISDNLEEAVREVNQLITTSYDIEQGTEFKVLDYSVPHKLYEVIEELHINKYEVTIPITGYYNTTVESFSKEEAIELVMNSDDTRKELRDVCDTVYHICNISDLNTDDTAKYDTYCDLVTS